MAKKKIIPIGFDLHQEKFLQSKKSEDVSIASYVRKLVEDEMFKEAGDDNDKIRA